MPELRESTPENTIPSFLRFRREQDYDRFRAMLAEDPEYSFIRVADPAWSSLGFREDWVEHAPTKRVYRLIQPQGHLRGLWEQVDPKQKGEDLPAQLRRAGLSYGDVLFGLIFVAAIFFVPGDPVPIVLGLVVGLPVLLAVFFFYLRPRYMECEPFRSGLARRMGEGAIVTGGLLLFFSFVWGFGWPLDLLVAVGMGLTAPMIVRVVREPPCETHSKIYLPMDGLQSQGNAKFPCLDFWERVDPDPLLGYVGQSRRREATTPEELRAGVDEALDAIESGNLEALLIIRSSRSTMLAITGHHRLKFAACMRSNHSVEHNGLQRPRWWNVEVGSGDNDHQRTRQDVHALVKAFLDNPKALTRRRIWSRENPL